MDHQDSPPQVVVFREVTSTSDTVRIALIKAGVAGLGALFTHLAIRQMNRMDKKKDELEKQLAEAKQKKS